MDEPDEPLERYPLLLEERDDPQPDDRDDPQPEELDDRDPLDDPQLDELEERDELGELNELDELDRPKLELPMRPPLRCPKASSAKSESAMNNQESSERLCARSRASR